MRRTETMMLKAGNPWAPPGWAERTDATIRANTNPVTVEHSRKDYAYETSCVCSTGELIDAMTEDAEEVTYEEFVYHCCIEAFCQAMCYDEDFPLKKDWHVSYWKSTYNGHPCYYLDHSRIEYIWLKRDEG